MSRKRFVLSAAATFVALLAIYSANGRSIGAGDTAPTTFLAAAVARGDSPVLDRYHGWFGQRLPYWVAARDGHLVSLYPVGPAVMAAPLVGVQIAFLAVVWPSWTQDEMSVLFVLGKNAAAVLAALTGVGLLVVLQRLGYEHDVFTTVAAAMLGSEMWTVASQSLWQHGPSAFALTVALALVLGGNGPLRLLAGGLAAGFVFACRIPSAIFVLPLVAWIAVQHRWRVGWFLAGMLPVVGLAIAYNVAWFGNWSGGIAVVEAGNEVSHAVSGRWNPHFGEGLAGTLLSPGRGLLVYCPWMAVVLLTLPWYANRLVQRPLVGLLAASLVPSTLLLGAYTTWWAGVSFGPRFWTDATPILAILLATCFAWTRERNAENVRAVLHAAILLAIGVQAIGAFCYPSSWNRYPTSVDLDHRRLWDWRDNEVTRCLEEGIHPAVLRPLSPEAVDSAYGVVRRRPSGR